MPEKKSKKEAEIPPTEPLAEEEEAVVAEPAAAAIEEDIPIEEDMIAAAIAAGKEDLAKWGPKTSIGMKVKNGEITDINTIFDSGHTIREAAIVDALLPTLDSDMIMIGQSRGKFGGGQRRAFKQTQRKTSEGNKPSFATMAVVGNHNGYVGIGYGKSKETVPAREKAIRNAKLNLFKIARGCGSWECGCKTPHSIPFKVNGKNGSVEVTLMPAPKGKGLVCEPEVAKILKMAGIKDVWSMSLGQTGTKTNMAWAAEAALRKLMKIKVTPEIAEKTGMVEGMISEGERNNG